jgi:antitoxin (DNA-binding transcriptional repressor) of toxin-antitoxin stability system
LGELIDKLQPGEEVVITRNAEPVAKLVMMATPKPPRQPGLLLPRHEYCSLMP